MDADHAVASAFQLADLNVLPTKYASTIHGNRVVE
jgi:hypothetical protein